MTPMNCSPQRHEDLKALGPFSPEWLALKFSDITLEDGLDLEWRECPRCGLVICIQLPPPHKTTAWLAGEANAIADGRATPDGMLRLFRAPLWKQLATLGITDISDYASAVGEYSSGYHRASRIAGNQ